MSARPIDPALPDLMANILAHRGPDDSGIWLESDHHVAFAHRRLSIVDLSPAGHQPMFSSNGRYVITFNGEIYNHSALRNELESSGGGPRGSGQAWRGHSDTETLLEACAFWGIRATLQKAVGMFALALWDRKERRLILARDRFGEKPLYYGWSGGQFLFSSELTAINALPGFDNPISRSALQLYADRTYVPEPYSIYERIFKLPPGSILTASKSVANEPMMAPPGFDLSSRTVKLERYWSYEEVVAEGLSHPFASEEEALEQLDAVLSLSIRGQSVADVPVGAFLSGGIDSSTVVAFYQRNSSQRVRTFSIGFEDAAFNEAIYAKKVAAYLGTEHNELYVTPSDARDIIPLLPDMYGEPFADSSQIPTHLVSRFARDQVKVALSGDGGDELFGGYNRYFEAARLWNHLKRLPRGARSGIGSVLAALSPRFWNVISPALPGGRRPPHFGSKVQKAMRTIAKADGLNDVYASFVNEWAEDENLVAGAANLPIHLPMDLCPHDHGIDDAVRMMSCDAITYLPGDILCKVDRAAMAVSLETRVPFLDPGVAAVAARIPIHMKIGGGKGKLVLRKLLYRHAPPELFERPKAGFGIPIGQWLRGPLRPWAEAILDERRLREDGFFDPTPVRRRWAEHLAGREEAGQALWPIIMFCAWRDAERSVLRVAPQRRVFS